MEIEPLCKETKFDHEEKCIGCGIDKYTRVVYDQDANKDMDLVNGWILKQFDRITEVLPTLMQYSLPYYHHNKQKFVFLSTYENIYDLIHNTNIALVPAEFLECCPEDCKSASIDKYLETYPDDGVIVWIRVQQPIVQLDEFGNEYIKKDEDESDTVDDDTAEGQQTEEEILKNDSFCFQKAAILRYRNRM